MTTSESLTASNARPARESPLFETTSCADVDEQAALLGGWQQNYAQMSAGRFFGAFAEARFEDVHLFVESTGQDLFQSGELPAELVAIGVPLEMHGSGVFCGAGDHEAAIHAFSGEGGFEFYSPAGLVMGGLVVSRQSLLAAVSEHEREAVCRCLERPHLRSSRGERVAGAREFVRGVFDMLENAPQLLRNAPLRQSLRSAALSNLAELLIDEVPAENLPIPPSRRWQIVASAREFVLSRPESPATVADLCRATGTSRRTLQYCFQDVLNVSPVVFLRSLRLNGVRRRLRRAPSVAEAATHWGFWHFGHFARDYRALFCELPSETHRRFQAERKAH